ncbi:AB1gp41 [Acinetobacter phage AB1]|uniref:AB1gp41 n=1 Tax=Acinetobacter phage AB1 TaxID=889876 RepID=E2GLX9_9CAUD|nr:AB1gp41 [Acinetobacter phage AB1]ADO14412.1 AB1gp41 [Acinetobacter phage AB1]
MKQDLDVQVVYALSRDEVVQFPDALGLDITGAMAICYWDGFKLIEKLEEAFWSKRITQEVFFKLNTIISDNYSTRLMFIKG